MGGPFPEGCKICFPGMAVPRCPPRVAAPVSGGPDRQE